MPRVLVVVFDHETDAREGEKALRQLDREGSIRVHCHAVVTKQTDGAVELLQMHDFGPFDSVLSTPVASLIALLGGPEGLAPSADTGFTSGRRADSDNARLGRDFVEDVAKALVAGKSAVVAEISENWTARVDARMEQLGGIVFRRTLSAVRRTRDEDDLAAMQADVDQLKDEQSLSDTDRKAELQEKIDQLDSRMHALESIIGGCDGTWQADSGRLQVGTGLAAERHGG